MMKQTETDKMLRLTFTRTGHCKQRAELNGKPFALVEKLADADKYTVLMVDSGVTMSATNMREAKEYIRSMARAKRHLARDWGDANRMLDNFD